jgi:quercetin dioxygenase-like cupin family protein
VKFEPGRTSEPAQPGTQVCATTGDVLIDNMLKEDGVSVNGAMFKPGAHTFWHSHERGQIFFISSGRGMIATQDGHAHEVRSGDVVYAPPGEVHWHGAAPDCFVTYTSISLGATKFGEDVASADYASHWDEA